MVNNDPYNYLEGYGIFCGKKCVARKKALGIPPKGGTAVFTPSAQTAAVPAAQRGWTPTQTALVAGGALVSIVILVIVFRRTKAKK